MPTYSIIIPVYNVEENQKLSCARNSGLRVFSTARSVLSAAAEYI